MMSHLPVLMSPLLCCSNRGGRQWWTPRLSPSRQSWLPSKWPWPDTTRHHRIPADRETFRKDSGDKKLRDHRDLSPLASHNKSYTVFQKYLFVCVRSFRFLYIFSNNVHSIEFMSSCLRCLMIKVGCASLVRSVPVIYRRWRNLYNCHM